MTASDLVAALQPLIAAFDALGVRYYVTGSVASSAHGIARASLDVDVVAEIDPAHVDRIAAIIESEYYVPRERMRAAAEDRASFNLIHLTTMFKVDVFVAKDRAFDRHAVDRASPQKIDESSDSPVFNVGSAEDIVLAKLEWFRRGGETSERHWRDIVGILRVTQAVDRAYLTTWAAALGVGDLLERAVAEAAE
jgi:hypothetical protein